MLTLDALDKLIYEGMTEDSGEHFTDIAHHVRNAARVVYAKITEQNEAVQEFTKTLVFIADLAQEELPHCKVGTGAEVALRHINRKACEMLASELMKRFPE